MRTRIKCQPSQAICYFFAEQINQKGTCAGSHDDIFLLRIFIQRIYGYVNLNLCIQTDHKFKKKTPILGHDMCADSTLFFIIIFCYITEKYHL